MKLRVSDPMAASRRWSLAAVVFGALLLAGGARAAERLEGPTPWRIGGRIGFTCDAAAFPDSDGYHLEVYLRVPPATLAGLERDENGDAQMHAVVRVRPLGRPEIESSQDLSISLADTARGQGRVLLLRFPVVPGPCHVDVRLEDL